MFDFLFDNIGAKIKTVAKIFFIIEVIAAIITSFLLSNFIVGLLIVIGGFVVAWLSSLTLYGFGDLIENIDVSNINTFEIHKLLKEIKEKQE